MHMRRIWIWVAMGIVLTGCTKIEQEPLAVQTQSVATATTQLSAQTESSEPAAQYDSVALQVPEITRQEVSLRLEAEDTALPEKCSVVIDPRRGYSGDGYVSGLNANYESSLEFSLEIPATQHYDITLVVGAGAASSCKILANGEPVYTLVTDSTENFIRVTVQGIFLTEGTCELAIAPVDGLVDIDCIELTNNTSLYDDSASLDTVPVDAAATENTVQLYAFLQEQYGKKLLTGQHVSSSKNEELEEIYQITGKYPLIRFDDLRNYSPNGGDASAATAVADSLAWAESGGIVGLSWLWNAPTGTGTIYQEESSFSLQMALTDVSVADRSLEQLRQMEEVGEISQSCYALISDIDAIAEALAPLAEADVPVLWRPLPEAGGGWYWWGADGAEAYQWLWDLLYTRLTDYHQLHNLLWVWNGQSASYLVDESQYDIASLDLYVDAEESYGSRYEQYVALRNMTPGKLLAISEASTLPDINAMFRDNAVWLYCGLWYAPYLGEYTDDATLISFYNSEGTLTREDAPAFSH